MSCMVQNVDRLEREMLELVRRKTFKVCVCVCVLELAGPVSVHALEPVLYTTVL